MSLKVTVCCERYFVPMFTSYKCLGIVRQQTNVLSHLWNCSSVSTNYLHSKRQVAIVLRAPHRSTAYPLPL